MRKLWVVVAALLLCFTFSTPAFAARHKVKEYNNKETTVDMSKMQHIAINALDLPTEEGALYGYGKDDWTELMTGLNQKLSRCVLDRDVTIVNSLGSSDATKYDLYIKFKDVNIDYEYYHLIVGIHFIDPKTGADISVIPARPYYGNDWGFKGFMNAAMDEVCKKVQIEVTGAPREK